MTRFTILDQGSPTTVNATIDGGRVRIAPADLQRALGWELKPEGFCRDDVCYPVPRGSDLTTAAGVDLQGLSDLLGRPLALDIQESAAFLGESAATRADQLASLEAPDFTLPDLQGRPHTLSDYRGKKVLLVAYASW